MAGITNPVGVPASSMMAHGQAAIEISRSAWNVKTKFAASMVYKEYKTQARTDIDFTALAAMPALVEESLPYTTE
jgi:hypothetical protein